MRADWMASGACTSGSTAHPRGATRRASGGAATMSTPTKARARAEAEGTLPMERAMTDQQIAGHDDWIAARGRFPARKKGFRRLREELSRERRELPWECVKKEYLFEGENGAETLAHLFGGRSQLIVYHFMYEPDWDIGCKNGSFGADDFNGILPHLNELDMPLVATSRGPLKKFRGQAKRCGWPFEWDSSVFSDILVDFSASCAPEIVERGVPFSTSG